MKRKSILAIISSLIALTAFCAVCLFSSAQGDVPQVLIESQATEWRYKTMTAKRFGLYNYNWTGSSEVIQNWKSMVSPFGDRIDSQNGSDKSNWTGNDHVLLLVTTFRIDDLDQALKKEFIAHIFYDNTMTIYLNGEEIFYDAGWVDDYVDLKLENFPGALVEGNNTLAVSVEDDMGGREFDMTLTMQTPTSQPPVTRPPEITPPDPSLTLTDSQLQSTGLSTLYIDTDDGDYVKSRLEYKSGSLRIGLSDSDKSYTNAFTGTGGEVKLKGRGNSTWSNGYHDGKPGTLGGDTHTRKVPYTLKLSEKADLFGMGKSKKWVLIANYMDRTMMRNKLIYDLSGRMGMVFCKSVYVNLVLNGEYMGTYALTQKIDPDLFGGQVTDWEDVAEDFAKAVAKKEGKNAIWQSNFEDRLCADVSWLTSGRFEGYKVSDYVDLSKYSVYTGYLIEYDGYNDEDSFFTTNHGIPLKVSNMEAIKTNPTLFGYVQGYFNDFEEACYAENFCNSKGKHYSEYVDMDSLVDCFILNTVILNVEFGYKSMYMYINSEGKLVFGPCWDFDWSSGNPFLGANGDYNAWYNDGRAGNNKWYRELYGDPYFVSLVRERWSQLEDALNEMVDSMDYYSNLLSKAETLEYAKFSSDPFERDFAWRTGGRSFKDECNQLKKFLQKRIAWLDEQFAKRDPNIEGFGMQTDESLILKLSGSSIASGGEIADFRLSRSTKDFTLEITSAHDCTVQVWINGACKYNLDMTKNTKRTQVLSGKDMLPGINTITVCQYKGDQLYGVNYLTLLLDGTKRTAPLAGSYTGGYVDKIVQPPKTQEGEKPPVTSVSTEKTVAQSSQKPVTGQPPIVSDPAGTTSQKNSAGSTPIVTTSTLPSTSGGQTNPAVSSGTGTGTGIGSGSESQPPKTPTPTGGTADIDPANPEPPDTEKDGDILPVIIAAVAVISAGAVVAVIIVIRKKRKE